MASDAAEVKVKLVLDSNAEKVTENLKKGFMGLGQSAKTALGKVDTSVAGNLGSLKSLAVLGFGAAAAAAAAAGAAIVGVATYSAHAFMESEAQVKALAGSFMLLSDTGIGFKEMKGYASGIKDELEELAMVVGTTDDEMVAVFNNVIERGGKSVEQAKELTESMALAGRALPGGAEKLSEAFEGIQMGMIKAKNPIVGMIAATGLLHGNAKQVAAEMSKMSVEKQMALAEKAVTQMGEKMKNTPLGFGAMLKSLQVGIGNVFETAGEPIMKAITPVLGMVRDFFMENQGAINALGAQFGDAIGGVVQVAGPILKEVFKVMKESSGDFKKAFNEIIGPAKGLFSYIYDNKDAFAKTIGDILRLIISVSSQLISAMTKVRDIIGSVLGAVGKPLLEMVAPGSARFASQEKQAGILGGMRSEVKGMSQSGAGDAINDATYNKLRKDFIAAADPADVAEAGANFDKAYRQASDNHKDTLASVGFARDAAMNDDAAKFAAAFDLASKSNDLGAQKYVMDFLDQNVGLQNALSKAGPDIFKTGFDNFTSALSAAGGGDVADSIKKNMAKFRMGDLSKSTINQTFTGGIVMKQDFRDNDPDRVATAFKAALGNAGTSRLQARAATPFGF